MKYEYRQHGDWSAGGNSSSSRIFLAICCLALQFINTGVLSIVNIQFILINSKLFAAVSVILKLFPISNISLPHER